MRDEFYIGQKFRLTTENERLRVFKGISDLFYLYSFNLVNVIGRELQVLSTNQGSN